MHFGRIAFHRTKNKRKQKTVWISYNNLYTQKALRMREIIKKTHIHAQESHCDASISLMPIFRCVFYCYRIQSHKRKCNTQCLRLFIYSFICLNAFIFVRSSAAMQSLFSTRTPITYMFAITPVRAFTCGVNALMEHKTRISFFSLFHNKHTQKKKLNYYGLS